MPHASEITFFVFPHQLFENSVKQSQPAPCFVLIEDDLFFGDRQYTIRFHKQKLAYHRATMKHYQATLEAADHRTHYIEHDASKSALKRALDYAQQSEAQEIHVCDPHDFSLEKRLHALCRERGLKLRTLPSPGFLNSRQDNTAYRTARNRWFMADFYKSQRRRLDVLMENDAKPVGGRWSFDEENRKKVPKKQLGTIPQILPRKADQNDIEARDYVEARWPHNPGSIDNMWYPTDHKSAQDWLDRFLHERFHHFGDFEDAIVEGENWLWHSVLTPMLNTGLLTPSQVLEASLAHGSRFQVPLNALEGFVRQIIGWREFMRATYDDLGVKMRTTNHWNHTNPLPKIFYTATTGIDPIDDTIQRINDTAYCHHIERLMVLGGFMFLCEIDPDEIYRWFMEMFIDSYDWVMVPNVYAMSQNADGGLITTKPYFSGSAYIKKMSHHKHGPWADIWDGLYWRWIWNHRQELGKNPRWAMMCKAAERMDSEKMAAHQRIAAQFLATHFNK